jgi:hypothetical protein
MTIDQSNNPLDKPSEQPVEVKTPNETGGISVTGFVKIFDPNTKEIIVETRA